MRRTLLLSAIALVASIAGPARADLASCEINAGPRGFPPQVTGLCHSALPFTTTGDATSVTITLRPSESYTGFLKGYVYSTNPGEHSSVEASGVFIAGELVEGTASSVGTLSAGTGWRLRLETKWAALNPYQVPGTGGTLVAGDFGFGAASAVVQLSSEGQPG